MRQAQVPGIRFTYTWQAVWYDMVHRVGFPQPKAKSSKWLFFTMFGIIMVINVFQVTDYRRGNFSPGKSWGDLIAQHRHGIYPGKTRMGEAPNPLSSICPINAYH